MLTLPIPPISGQKISASLIAHIIRYLRAITPKAGYGTRVSIGPNGAVIACDAVAKAVGGTVSKTAKPYDVRWRTTDEDGNGQWEIYLPVGCATLNGNIVFPVNGQVEDGEGNEIYGWRKIEEPSDVDAEEVRHGYLNGLEWPVYVHFKPWEQMKASTKKSADEEEGWKYNEKSVVVATIRKFEMTGSEGTTSLHTVNQLKNDIQELTRDTSSAFSIRYITEGDPSDPNCAYKAMLVNCTHAFGRLQIENEDVDVTDKNAIVLKVSHSSTSFDFAIVDELKESTDDETYIRLYELKGGVVQSDTRNLIERLPFYNWDAGGGTTA